MTTQPTEILARMAAAYAACAAYRDDGVVTTTFFDPSKRVERRPFSTRFVRGQGFVFEFRSRRGEEDWDQYAVWVEGAQTRSWWSAMPGRDEPESLGMALGGATGVSGGSAHRVPHLLMPELHTRNGEAPPDSGLRFVEVPEAESENCLVIERARAVGSAEQIWIDRSAMLIRRVVEPRHPLRLPPEVIERMPEVIERMKGIHPEAAAQLATRLAERAGHRPIDIERITTYEPAIDTPVSADELVFAPAK